MNDGCYRAYGIDFEGNITLSELDGSDVKEPEKESKCKLDWNAMSADGSVEYAILGSWELEKGDYLLRVECVGTCANETIWLTSIDEMESGLIRNPLGHDWWCCLLPRHFPLAPIWCSSRLLPKSEAGSHDGRWTRRKCDAVNRSYS